MTIERAVDIISRRSMEQETSPDAAMVFAEIVHGSLDETIRLAADGADWLFEGVTYSKGGFEISLVTDDENPPTAKFAFPNINRAMMAKLETLTDPAEVRLAVVSSAYFNIAADPRAPKAGMTPVAFYEAKHLLFTDVSITAEAVTGTLRARDLRQEIWPGRRATPDQLPGLWP